MNVALFADPLSRLSADLLAVSVFEDALEDSWAFKAADEALDEAKKVIENVLRNQEAAGWGPNAIFRFPREVSI